MNESEALGRVLGWMLDLYLFVGIMLAIVLVPRVEKALNEYWFSTENAVWTRIIATLVAGVFLLRSCA